MHGTESHVSPFSAPACILSFLPIACMELPRLLLWGLGFWDCQIQIHQHGTHNSLSLKTTSGEGAASHICHQLMLFGGYWRQALETFHTLGSRQ